VTDEAKPPQPPPQPETDKPKPTYRKMKPRIVFDFGPPPHIPGSSPDEPLPKQIARAAAEIAALREELAELQNIERPEEDDPAIKALRAEIFKALKELLPLAIQQAKGRPGRKESKGNRAIAAQPPRPALLRLILRATRPAPRPKP
jgi:hypothetical protein